MHSNTSSSVSQFVEPADNHIPISDKPACHSLPDVSVPSDEKARTQDVVPDGWKRQSKNNFQGVFLTYNGHAYNAVIKRNHFSFDAWIQNPPRNFWALLPSILNTRSGWAGLSFKRDPKNDTLVSFIALIEEILDIAWGKPRKMKLKLNHPHQFYQPKDSLNVHIKNAITCQIRKQSLASTIFLICAKRPVGRAAE